MAQIKKSGWISIIVLIIVAAGIYFISSLPAFNKYKHYYAYYKSVSGLQPSSPVMIKGVRVGKIKSIDVHGPEVKVVLSVDKNINLPTDTKASLTSGGLLSDMSIVLVTSNSTTILPDESRINSELDTSVMPVSIRVTPYLETAKYLLKTADTTLTGIDFLTSSGMFTTIIKPLMTAEKTLGAYARASDFAYKQVNGITTTLRGIDKNSTELADNSRKWNNTIHNLDQKTASLAKDSLQKSFREIASLTRSLSGVVKTASDPKTNVGKLVNDNASYKHTNAAIKNMNESAEELYQSPPGFRLIGKNKKKK